MHCTNDTNKKTVELSNAEIKAILIKLLKDENAIKKDSIDLIQLDYEDKLYSVDVWKTLDVPDKIVFNFTRKNDNRY